MYTLGPYCLFKKCNKWFLLIEKYYLLAIRGKRLHVCIMELGLDQIVPIIFGLRLNL